MTQKWQNTGQTLFTACATLQDALRQFTSTSSAPGSPSQRIDIPTANLRRKPWAQGNLLPTFSFFQLLVAPLLGQCALKYAATMFSNSAKLLMGL